jgi:uncharacterized membrane protein YphA (DoxX/SURF4 family)
MSGANTLDSESGTRKPRSGLPGGLTTVVLRSILAALFLIAGVLKAMEHPQFFTELMEYELFEAPLAYDLSWVIIGVEVVFGFWLLTGAAARIAAWFGMGLISVFTAALVSAWWRELELSCACFGPIEPGGGYLAWFIRNVIFFVAFAWLAWRSPPLRLQVPLR